MIGHISHSVHASNSCICDNWDNQAACVANAPINVMPHYPHLGNVGDLNFAKFKSTTYWACQSVKSQTLPH